MRVDARETEWIDDYVEVAEMNVQLGSPCLIRTWLPEQEKMWSLDPDDPRANDALTSVLMRKVKQAGLTGNVRAEFLEMEPVGRKMVQIHQVKNICYFHPVRLIADTPELLQFALRVGVGSSTGAGFGFIMNAL
jgi:CRISPR-associated endoribonuclease Cas6